MTSREFHERLARRTKRAGLSVSSELAGKLEVYFRLLAAWNGKVNLSGLDLDDPSPDAIDRLLIEPMAAARHLEPTASRMMDVGSGGGSPAIPMVLAAPRLSLLMVESKTRKAVFLREALRALELQRADVATARFEELLARPDLHEAHDVLTIRAVRVESRVLMNLQAFMTPGGRLLLFRGSGSVPEGAVHPPLALVATHPLVESLRSRLLVLEKGAVGR